MSCKKCCGLVVEDHGEWRCLNCGCRPFETRITVKCSNPDCFALPELHNYCARCWHSRVRDPRTEAEKSKAYRERMRLKQQKRRAKLKEESCSASRTITDNPCGSLPEGISVGAMSAGPGDLTNLGA